jgi:hypothetical protein
MATGGDASLPLPPSAVSIAGNSALELMSARRADTARIAGGGGYARLFSDRALKR